jgi:hypothetical protein
MTTSDEENQSIGSILQDTTENPDPPEPKQETGVPTPDSVESTPKRNKTLLTDLGFRKSPRGVIELSRAGVEYSHERRALMKERELQQLHKIVTSPLTVKFGMMGDSTFTEVYDFESRMTNFQKRLHCYSLDGVFQIRTKLDGQGNIIGSGEPVELFKKYRDVSLEQILQSNRFYHTYGTEEHLQDLVWSGQLLENSTESTDGLNDKIQAKMATYPEVQQGGPLYLKILIDLVTSLTHQAAASLVTSIRTLTLMDDSLAGEDIDLAVAYMRGVYHRLEVCNHIPPDMISIIVDVFATASTKQFAETFTSLRTMMVINPDNVYTLEAIFDIAGNLYKALRAEGKWCALTARNKKQAAFSAGAFPHITCHKCHKKGHYATSCPGGDGATDTSTPGGGTPPKRSNRRTPPAAGEPTTRPRAGNDGTALKDKVTGQAITEYYCEVCRIWNLNHLTAQHVRKSATIAPSPASATPPASAAAASAVTPPAETAAAAGSNVPPAQPQPVVVIGGVATHSASNNLKQLINPGGRNKFTQCVSNEKK